MTGTTTDSQNETGSPVPVIRSGDWLAVSFGGGTNSTGMLCGFRERGIRPDVAIFADTGGEVPRTYEHVAVLAAKVQEWWGITLHTVHPVRAGKPITLEQDCVNKGLLPSLAYGRRSCSQRSKHEPMEKLLKALAKADGVTQVRKAIGYGADEYYRVKNKPLTGKLARGIVETYWYPLVEWNWRREDCVAAIERHGLPQPGKSACFFCPASKRSEVLRLRDEHPELLARALAMEAKAQARHRSLRGLGGANNLWADWLTMDEQQSRLMLDIEPMHAPCGCYDGGD